jgi:hypothetical protein
LNHSVDTPSVGKARRHGEGARNEQVHRRGALKRAEVAFVKKRREELWECPNRFCGAQILFLMIGPTPKCADPTCFCGSTMQRVVRARGRRNRSNERYTNPSTTRGANDSPMLLYSLGIRHEK